MVPTPRRAVPPDVPVALGASSRELPLRLSSPCASHGPERVTDEISRRHS